jgi:hypothetical protein
MKNAEAIGFVQAEILAMRAMLDNLLERYASSGTHLARDLVNAGAALSCAAITLHAPGSLRPLVKGRFAGVRPTTRMHTEMRSKRRGGK